MKTLMGIAALVAGLTLATVPAFAQASGSSPSSQPAPSANPSETKNPETPKAGARMNGSASAEQTKAVQQALRDQGHDPGSVDGKMGPRTQAALRDYQQKQGLKATGRLDAETMAKLGVDAKTSAAPSSSPAASPSTTAPASPDAKSDPSVTPERKPQAK